jgi:hypothetical protein
MKKTMTMKATLVLAALFAVMLAASAASAAAEPIGAITLLSGKVTLTRGTFAPAKVSLNEKVYQADLLETAPGARARITFSDGSVMSMAEKSRLRLDEYVYSPQDGNRSAVASLLNGKVKCLVAKLSGTRNRFDVSTPTAIIGTRGTIFVVIFDAQTQITQVYCLENAVQVQNVNIPGVTVTVTENLGTVFGPNQTPPTPQPITQQQLEQILQQLSTRSTQGTGGTTQGNQPQGGPPAGGLDAPDTRGGTTQGSSTGQGLNQGLSTAGSQGNTTPPTPPWVTHEGVLGTGTGALPEPPVPPVHHEQPI